MHATEVSEDTRDGSVDVGRPTTWLGRLALVPVIPWMLVAIQFADFGDTIVRQHDNLDGYQAILARMSWADLFAVPGTMLPYLLGGYPRDFFGSEFFLGHVIGVALPVLWSLFVTAILIRTMAFYGMRTLIRTAGLGDYKVITYGVATVFALLPFYTPAFGAVAAAPFLLAAFLRTLESGRLAGPSLAVIALFPLVAPAYATIPYAAFLLLVVVVLAPFYRSQIWSALVGIGVLGFSVLVVDWRLFYASLFGPESHRSVESGAVNVDWSLFSDLAYALVSEAGHVPLGKSRLLVLVFGFAAALLAAGWRRIDRRRLVLIGALITAIVVAGLIEQLWGQFEVGVLATVFEGWGRFQMGRVRWIEPMALYLLLALALTVITDIVDWGRARRGLSVVVVVVLLSAQGWIVVSMNRFVAAPNSLTVSEFYATDTMSEVAEAIRVDGGGLAVSVGLHPAVAIANGIDNADGYASAYPLEYKHRFRELIAPALDASPENRRYFDNWGSRAYVFQPDFPRPGFSGPSASGIEIELVVEPLAFGSLGITHVISSSPFINSDEIGLELVLETGYSDELGPVWLYRVR